MPQPDYENDLVFPPQEIKSQHELSEQGRQSDVLIKAIEKCEKLEKEIIALKKEYQAECNRADELEDSLQTSWRNESKLKKQLEIAIKALDVYADIRTWDCCCRNQCAYVDGFEAAEALRKIKELDE